MVLSHEFPNDTSIITKSMPKLSYCYKRKMPRKILQGVVNLTIF